MTALDATAAARAVQARVAARQLAALSGAARSELLATLAARLRDPTTVAGLLAANEEDLAAARAAAARGELEEALVPRLVLDAEKLSGLAQGLDQLASQPELVGRVLEARELDQDLVLTRVACPLGVLGVVFESRPDALPQITGLALKSGNAVLLKGGAEALASNRALVAVIAEVLSAHGVPPGAVVLLEGRAEVDALLALERDVDLIIARGSGAFVRAVTNRTHIPVLGHAEGLCHLYLDATAPPELAAPLARDAKCSYPAACNAIETLLWHREAGAALDATVNVLNAEGVRLLGCPATCARHSGLAPATEEDWATEYGTLVLSIRRVDDLEGALAHIARYGSRHTETIVSADPAVAERFLAEVDAACVFHNASSRFADGYRFGLGAEVGISTGKLHARGPVGVQGLLTYRWLLRGAGQVASAYGPGKRAFRHREI